MNETRKRRELKLKRCLAYILDSLIIIVLSLLIAVPFEKANDLDDLFKELEIEKLTEHNEKKLTKKQKDKLYEFNKKNSSKNLIITFASVGMLIVIPLITGGDTLGQKMFRLETTSNNIKAGVLIRGLLIYPQVYSFVDLIFLKTTTQKGYYMAADAFTLIQMMFLMILFFAFLFSKNNKGLHDYIAQTEVIKIGD